MKKKLLSVVLAVAVAFTFSFAMVGTASADVPSTPAHIHHYATSEAVVWGDDFTTATVAVKCTDKDCENPSAVAKLTVGDWTPLYKTDGGSQKFTGVYEVKATAGNDVIWEPGGFNATNTTAFVINLNDAAATISDVDADGYAAYLDDLAGEDVPSITNPMESNASVKTKKAGLTVAYDDIFFQAVGISPVAYEKYDEGSYDVTFAANESTKIKDSQNVHYLNSEQLIQLKDKTINVLGSIAAKANIVVNHPEFTYNLDGFVDDEGEAAVHSLATGKDVFTYDGKDHSVVVAEKNVTVKYIVKENKDLTNKEKAAITDASYTADKATVKNAGKYYVYALAKLKTKKADYKDYASFVITVNKKKVDVFPKQNVYTKTFDGEGITLDADAFKVIGICEGDTLVTGVETTDKNVGDYKMFPVYDEAVLANYKPEKVEFAKGVITKADNDIHVHNKTLSIKRGAKKELDVKADFGDVTFQKTSGTSKVYVSKDGVVKVAKSAKKGKVYSVKVKASVKGSTNYNADSKTVALKIKVK